MDLRTTLTDWFYNETESVYCAVRAEFFNTV